MLLLNPDASDAIYLMKEYKRPRIESTTITTAAERRRNLAVKKITTRLDKYFFAAMALLTISGVAIFFLCTQNKFTILHVEVSGASSASVKKQLESRANSLLASKAYEVVPHGNILWLQLKVFGQNVAKGQSRIDKLKSAHVDIQSATLLLDYQSKELSAVVVDNLHAYLVNQDGTVANVMSKETWMDLIDFGQALSIKIVSDKSPFVLGSNVSTQETWESVTRAVEVLVQDERLSVEYEFFRDETGLNDKYKSLVAVIKLTGADEVPKFRLLLPLQNSKEALESLHLLLENLTQDQREHLSYVDMRVPGKGFVCLQATACDTMGPISSLFAGEAVTLPQENKINNQIIK